MQVHVFLDPGEPQNIFLRALGTPVGQLFIRLGGAVLKELEAQLTVVWRRRLRHAAAHLAALGEEVVYGASGEGLRALVHAGH